MNEPVHAHPQSSDSDSSQKAERGGTNSRAEVNDHGSKQVGYIALCLGVAALVVSLISLDRTSSTKELNESRYADLVARNQALTDSVRLAEREAKLAREDIRIMQVGMAEYGINTDEHQTGRKRK